MNVVLVTAYNPEGQLLIGRRADNGLYTIVAGHLNPGEDPKLGALREFQEETGCFPKSLSYLTHYTTSEGVNLYCYSAMFTDHPHSNNDPDQEVEEWEFVDPLNIPSRIYKHLNGPKDKDENLLLNLFKLKKAETEVVNLKKTTPDSSVPTIIMVRHGSTALNDPNNEKLRGWADVPLDEKGKKQAEDVAEELKDVDIGSIYCSDLGRTCNTAEAIANFHDLEPVPNKDLRPWDQGEMTGKSVDEYVPVMLDYIQNKPDKKIPGSVESFNQFKARIIKTYNNYADLAIKTGKTVCLVAHSRNVRMLRGWVLAGAKNSIYLKPLIDKVDPIEPGGFMTIEFRDGKWVEEAAEEDLDDSRDLNKTETPLLRHPNPAERMLALKLNPSADNLYTASLDHNPLVWQLAVDHSNYNDELSLKTVSAQADSDGNFPAHQINHILDNRSVQSSHLRSIYNNLAGLKPECYTDMVNKIGSRTDLEPDLWHDLYHNPDLAHDNRVKLLGYGFVPPEVLNNAINEGIRSESLDSIELGKKAIEHPTIPQEEVEKLINSAIGSNSESLLSIAAHALAKRRVSEQLINDLQNQSKHRFEHNHARLRLSALMGPGANSKHLDRAMEDPSAHVRNGLMFAPKASPKHINGVIERAVKDKDREGIKKLLSHPTISGKHLNMLIKAEQGLINYFVKENPHKTAILMLGGCMDHKSLKAAKLLSGFEAQPKDIDESKYRSYLISVDGDSDKAALLTYGIEPTEFNLKALKGIKEIAGLNKNQHVAPQPQAISNVYPEGQAMADALKRAFRDQFVFPLELSGKHSEGAMVARDEVGGKSYLLKPSAGGNSPIIGFNEEKASQATREAAFYYVAKLWGLEHWFVESNLIIIDTKEYAVMELLPWSWETFDHKRKEDSTIAHKILNPLINNGIIFQWAVLAYVLADGDEHANNAMIGPELEIKLIDHGSAFSGQSFNPKSDPSVFIPFYLRINDKTFPEASAQVNQELMVWLNSLNAQVLAQALERFNIQPHPEVMRLVRLQAEAGVIGVDKAIKAVWTR